MNTQEAIKEYDVVFNTLSPWIEKYKTGPLFEDDKGRVLILKSHLDYFLRSYDALTHAIDVMKRSECEKDLLQKLEAKVRQKKGFYSLSVGHDEIKKAHKTGIQKGLDVVHKEIKTMIAAATLPAAPEAKE